MSNYKSASKKVYADFHGKDPQIDPLLKNPLRNFSPLRSCGAGNRKHFYYYDLGANKLEKIPGISGGGIFANSQLDNAESLTNLSRLFVSPHQGSDYFAIAGGDSGNIAVLSQKTIGSSRQGKPVLHTLNLSSI